MHQFSGWFHILPHADTHVKNCMILLTFMTSNHLECLSIILLITFFLTKNLLFFHIHMLNRSHSLKKVPSRNKKMETEWKLATTQFSILHRKQISIFGNSKFCTIVTFFLHLQLCSSSPSFSLSFLIVLDFYPTC